MTLAPESPHFQHHSTPPRVQTRCKPAPPILSTSRARFSLSHWTSYCNSPRRQQQAKVSPVLQRDMEALSSSHSSHRGSAGSYTLPYGVESTHTEMISHMERDYLRTLQRHAKGHKVTSHYGQKARSHTPCGSKKIPGVHIIASYCLLLIMDLSNDVMWKLV